MCMSLTCCCVGGVCKICCCSIPVRGSVTTRLVYTFGLFLVTLLAWVLRNWGDTIFPESFQLCAGQCFQYTAVFRVSLAFLLYHLTLCIWTIGVTTSRFFRAKVHNGWWPLKIVLLGGLLAACFFVPASSFQAYSYVCIALGVLFMIVQTVLILDFAYSWAEKWVEYYEENFDPCWKIALIGTSAFCYCGVIIASVLLYINFAVNPGCGLNIFFITFNIIIVIVISVGSVLPRVQEANPRSGLLQASILSLYLTYVVSSAIGSQPNDDTWSCATQSSGNSVVGEILFYVGFAGTFLSICVSAFSTGSSDEPFTPDADDKDPADDEKEGTKYHYYLFHLTFCLAAGYFATLLTNWSVVNGIQDTDEFAVDRGFGSVWAKMAASWLIALLYIWTLVAPILFPNRFGN